MKDLVLKGAGVEFKGVTFGYNPDRNILKGFTLSVKPGSTVAVVGSSGCGCVATASFVLTRTT